MNNDPTEAAQVPSSPDHVINPSLKRISVKRGSPGCFRYIKAVVGSVFIGVTLPSILVIMRCIHQPQYTHGLYSEIGPIGTFAAALFGCGPGAVLLSCVLLSTLSNRKDELTLRETFKAGAVSGIKFAFLNVPGYLVFTILVDDNFAIVRVLMLFVVAGATCGMWIAWQAWSGWYAETRILPRFTLSTLMVFVFAWGAVMLLFQPAQWPANQ